MSREAARRRLVIVSAVLPFPGSAGQQQRVRNSIRALREVFHLTFLTSVPAARADSTREKLLEVCDDALILPSRYAKTALHRLAFRAVGSLYALQKGLKISNYVVGQVELTSERVAQALAERPLFDCALFEYWHAWQSAAVLQRRGVHCVLDMHNVLWQSYARQLAAQAYLPEGWKRRAVGKYRVAEESAWQTFDALIAINRAEEAYTRTVIGGGKPVFYVPMGADLDQWPYSWQPVEPPRIAYYGGLGSTHNRQDARRCYEEIMPMVWQQRPDAELWLIGSQPPESLRALAERDRRVHVTGFVEEVQEVLHVASMVLCPWSGTYGFRSRLVEVMALGVPVVASPEAVYGMDLEDGRGIFLRETDEAMADACLDLLNNDSLSREQSRLARQEMEAKYQFDATYGQLTRDLLAFCGKIGT